MKNERERKKMKDEMGIKRRRRNEKKYIKETGRMPKKVREKERKNNGKAEKQGTKKKIKQEVRINR
jgi:hypothetical protein